MKADQRRNSLVPRSLSEGRVIMDAVNDLTIVLEVGVLR
jgi:hypothetical protein